MHTPRSVPQRPRFATFAATVLFAVLTAGTDCDTATPAAGASWGSLKIRYR